MASVLCDGGSSSVVGTVVATSMSFWRSADEHEHGVKHTELERRDVQLDKLDDDEDEQLLSRFRENRFVAGSTGVDVIVVGAIGVIGGTIWIWAMDGCSWVQVGVDQVAMFLMVICTVFWTAEVMRGIRADIE